MSELVYYTHPQSRGRIAHWMLEELGEPYRTVWLEYGSTMKAPEYLAVNPMGKVPALRDGDIVVTESAAICAYLADRFPQRRLAPPPGDSARAAYYRWMFFVAGPLEMATTAKALNWQVPEGRSSMVGFGSSHRRRDGSAPLRRGEQFTPPVGLAAGHDRHHRRQPEPTRSRAGRAGPGSRSRPWSGRWS